MPAGYDSPHPPPPPPPPGAPPPPHGPPPPPGPPPGFGHPGFDFQDFFGGLPGHGGQRFDHGPHHHGPPGFGPDFFGGRRGHRGGRGPRGGDTDEEFSEMMDQFREWGGRRHGGRRGHGHGRRGGRREEQEDTNDESGPDGFVDVNGEDREGSRPPPPRGPHGHGRHGRHFGGPPPPPPPPPPAGEAWGHFGFGGPWGHFGGGPGPWGFGPHHHHGRGGFGRGKKPFPRVDILANDEQVVLEVELPGVRKEDITARVDDEGSSVTIEGTFPERGESEFKRVYGERRAEAGESFSRTIPLPGPVDKDSVRAKLADGVLVITLAKVQVEEPQGTPVNIE